MPDTTTNGPATFQQQLASEIAAAGGPVPADPEEAGVVGRTMFDLPGSTDLAVTVLVPRDRIREVPSQALVRVRSRDDGRTYLGVVTAGPFAEPDGLKGDSALLVAVATHNGRYLPPFHGRVEVTLLGEELADGTLLPPRLRPLPNSPVFALDDAASATVLKCDGDVRLGLAAGHASVPVGVPSAAKGVFPRHTAVLGTTGGGKSNTVAGLVRQAQAAGMAVVLLDVEGEYTRLHEPTDDARMAKALAEWGLAPAGIPADRMTVYHLVGRDTTNPGHPDRRPFTLQFARLSPYAVSEILGLSEPQTERFFQAYDIAKQLLRDLNIFPASGDSQQERLALEIDEFERGYPRMTIPLLLDVVGTCLRRSEKTGKEKKGADEPEDGWEPGWPPLRPPAAREALARRVNAANPSSNAISWRALLGRLARLNRLKVFHDDGSSARPLAYGQLLRPGRVSVLDLSDTGFSELNNLVIADLLHGLQEAQDDAYSAYEQAKNANQATAQPPRVLIVVEEAHEFLSAERIDAMPVLFQQVERIAKRGRKRWLGLVFVTQLPGHLPRQVLGLCNSFVLHKLTDPQVAAALKRTVAGIDDALWDRLPALAPGQAIVSFPHLTRPLLVSVDPAPGKLRLSD